MIEKMTHFIIYYLLRFLISLRYDVQLVGFDKLTRENLKKPGGVLFLPNHPTVVIDPTIMNLFTWKRFKTRPLVVEYMYYAKTNNWLMRLINALPVPAFDNTCNSIKRKRNDRAFNALIQGLSHGENFLVYPGARAKLTAKEAIGGNSGTHQIIQAVPDANVVLVRIKGLWGSSFSLALGRSVSEAVKHGIKTVLKNLIFFTPRRKVIVEFEIAKPDFPAQGTRMELNRYLENWYNKPDGLAELDAEFPGDSLILVSYSRWKDEYLLPKVAAKPQPTDTREVPKEIQRRVLEKLREMTRIDIGEILPSMQLSSDLGMDSLDTAELAIFLHEEYDVKGVKIVELNTVATVMSAAAGFITFSQEAEEEVDLRKWHQPRKPIDDQNVSSGETLVEVCLNTCARMGNVAACADPRAGVLTYPQLKMRVILLAEVIRKLPGKYIGIMLPSSVAAYVLILACQLAGKIPLMINWTLGPRFLESVITLSQVQVVLSSWLFLDKLHHIDFGILDKQLVMLEDLRQEFTLSNKLKALLYSKRSTKAILAHFQQTHVKGDDTAVLLFTSGSESTPKGVPLSHKNILSNFRACVRTTDITSTDVILGILPPFHAFGFTMAGLLPLLLGVRAVYLPDPRESEKIAKAVQHWQVTLMCAAPTFLKGIMREAEPGQLNSLRLCWTGAEKAPDPLFDLFSERTGGGVLLEGYGVTECSPVLCMNSITYPRGGVGRPIDEVEILIVHPETYEPVESGTVGLILARGPNVFAGYLNTNIATPFVEVKGKRWYRTGDLGYLDEKGQLTIEGRLKRFVKIGGEMISLGAIEEFLTQLALKQGWTLPEEGPCLAVCASEAREGDKPRISLFTTFRTSVEEVNRNLLTAGFNNLWGISSAIRIPTIPILGIGKIDYKELEAMLLAQTAASHARTNSDAPTTV